MPETSTAVNGCAWKIELMDETGTYVDISGSANECEISFERELGDYKVFGSPKTFYLECAEDEQVSLTALYSRDMTEASSLLWEWRKVGGQRGFKATGGGREWQGNCLLAKLSMPIKADDAKPIMAKAELQPFGGLNWRYV